MESTKEPVVKNRKRPISASRYPKRMPTYVVAFAVQGTHDDPPPNQQQIPSKRSVENSASSFKPISPTGSNTSSRTFTITPTENLSQVDTATISEVKIDIVDENQCGDAEKKSPQISNYLVVDNRTADEQPEIIFNASRHIKKCQDNSKFPRKKPRKYKHVIKFKNINFKYKNQKKCITRRLEKYYEKTKMPNAEQIQKQIYCNNLSKVVSRSRVLKKVLAKENLLDDSDRISFIEGISFNDDGESFNSSPSTIKKSFGSFASQSTLIRKNSSLSRNDDFYSMKAANSVIQVSSDIMPYKTDIINVAVAVAFNATKPNINPISSESTETFMHKVNLTSEGTFGENNTNLTSKSYSVKEPKPLKIDYDELAPIVLNQKDQINNNLSHEKRSIFSSDDEAYVIARTSSDFNKSNKHSNCTLTSISDKSCRVKAHPNLLPSDELHNPTQTTALLDTVINFELYPSITSSSYGPNSDSDINDVLVTDTLIKSLQLSSKIKPDDHSSDVKKNLSVLKKSFEVEKVACPQVKISLPNGEAIGKALKETEKVQKISYDDENRNKYPTDLGEMWERLVAMLDLAVNRLEDSLAEKIIKGLAVFNQQGVKTPTLENQSIETTPFYDRPTPEMLHKEIFVLEDHLKRDADVYVQCNLVQNQIIDQLMLKLSIEGPRPAPTSTDSIKKLKKPEIVKDYFEILKAPTIGDSVWTDVGKGENMVSTSTATAETETIESFSKLKRYFTVPVTFLRENVFVITSVPTFFIVMLCLYGIIIISMKPW